jgi:hypothetical protein
MCDFLSIRKSRTSLVVFAVTGINIEEDNLTGYKISTKQSVQ